MKPLTRFLRIMEKNAWIPLSLCLVTFALIALLDLLTPENLSFTLFYLVPVALALWTPQQWLRWLIAASSALLWAADHLIQGDIGHFHSVASYWEVAVRFGFFTIFIVTVTTIRRSFGELQAMNARLAEAEGRYREVFEHSLSAIVLLDVTDGERFRVVDINPAVERMIGLKARDVAGRFVSDALPAEAARRLIANYRRCLQTGVPLLVEESADFPAGHVVYRSTLIPVRDERGRIRRLITLPIDMTEERRAQEARFESEALYREVFENTSDGIFVDEVTGDRRYRLLSCNPAQEAMFGICAADSVGRFIEEFLPAEIARQAREDNGRCLETGTPVSFERTFAFPSGIKHFHTTLVPVREPVGRIARLIGVNRDITEQKLAQERDREHERQLLQAAKLAALGTLVSGIAHEINNPNNYIRLNGQNLKEMWGEIRPLVDRVAAADESLSLRGIPVETAEDMVDDLLAGIEEGSKRIEKLLVNLRDFARGDAGDLGQQVDVNAVVDSAVLIAGNLIRKSTDLFSVRRTEGLPPVRGNYHQIEQIVINLVNNACQALASRDRTIMVSTSLDAGWIVLEVADQGIGIPREHLPRLTDPFFTTKRASGGSGLGLAVSSRIVSNHGGSLSFRSQPGAGTRATVRLPVPAEPAAEPAAER